MWQHHVVWANWWRVFLTFKHVFELVDSCCTQIHISIHARIVAINVSMYTMLLTTT